MKIHFTIVLLLDCLISASQIIEEPHWKEREVNFLFAKAKVYNTNTKKTVSDVYRDGKVSIWCDPSGSAQTVSIDVPNMYYFKDASVNSVNFVRTSESVKVSYNLVEGSKIAVVTIVYQVTDLDGVSVVIAGNEDYMHQKSSGNVIILYEKKEL